MAEQVPSGAGQSIDKVSGDGYLFDRPVGRVALFKRHMVAGMARSPHSWGKPGMEC
jgi:hypothetical protein